MLLRKFIIQGNSRMNVYTISSIGEFTNLITEKFNYGFMYRGDDDVENHQLIPSVGRYLKDYTDNDRNKSDLFNDEQNAFRIFYKEAVHFQKCDNYWQWLALAQHHVLATRLLDWSYSPLTSLFFAASKNSVCDAGVYVLDKQIRFLSVLKESKVDPFSINVHIYPVKLCQELELKVVCLLYILIQRNHLIRMWLPKFVLIKSQKIKFDLNHLGIHQKSLFPDLDGLSAWIRWMKHDCLSN